MASLIKEQQMNTQIAQIWSDTVKHGIASMKTGSMSPETTYFNGYLSANNKECSSNIRENDPLYYSAVYDSNTNTFKERAVKMYIAPPAGSHLALGSETLRCVTIKDVTPEKIAKRFNKILRELIVPNLTNINQSQQTIKEIYSTIEF
jgi:hypothetical protein